MTHPQTTPATGYAGFIRALLLPAALLWPIGQLGQLPALTDAHKMLALLALTLLLRHLERRPAAAYALVAATCVTLRAGHLTPQADALLDAATLYLSALSVSLALLERP
ncbi:hypothetical protein [Deinococcus soli (ex Cha et al. 2016)]|uniref:hypothetical protein n=1 Tax=Deinococcus soli (ex Cha et al. 2016) TaxID=1309411 RepID=UPI00166A9C22|nr:hypothetical protein [Deinococcus soli (ex Cha et al. 2016)]GGB73978.1 hypothetical protein GCM10008019_32740 [Deinococcus soli (ex Cha et al. 2016)]